MDSIEIFKRSFWGGVKGDIYGSVFEFSPAKDIPNYLDINSIKDNHKTNVFGHEFGHFTDDTIFMINAMQSFNKVHCFSEANQLNHMKDYIEDGEWSVNGKCFDIGNATLTAYNQYRNGTDEEIHPQVGGNGVLMKLAPYAFWSLHKVSKDDKINFYTRVCEMTHGSIAIESTIKFGLLLEAIYSGEPLETSQDLLLTEYTEDPTGFCAGSYNLALDEFYTDNDFDVALMNIIKKGGDTDTNACILGQLIGTDDFKYKYKEKVNPILEKFYELVTQSK